MHTDIIQENNLIHTKYPKHSEMKPNLVDRTCWSRSALSSVYDIKQRGLKTESWRTLQSTWKPDVCSVLIGMSVRLALIRPASRCSTETWPDLRLKSTPSQPLSTWSHSTWLDFTWQWHVTWVDFKRLHKFWSYHELAWIMSVDVFCYCHFLKDVKFVLDFLYLFCLWVIKKC